MQKKNFFLFFLLVLINILGCADSNKSPVYSPPNNLAYNSGYYYYPSPLESDDGWGGGVYKWHIIDGIRARHEFWTYGLAFTGGSTNFVDTCGWRQATINFGESKKFNRIVTFWMSPENTPLSFNIQIYNTKKSSWDTIYIGNNDINYLTKINNQIKFLITVPVFVCEDTFKTAYSQKIRYSFNNCKMIAHGWLFEFEVYYDKPGERPKCLFFNKLK